ncbi:MAG TPA: DoxX family membrane protein [Acidobacteriaceae bacterium]|nr:DoxX family membrane protein [Acidobacteriaceae bacterium]
MITHGGEMVYLITTAVLISTVACYFLWGRSGLFSFGWVQWLLRAVVALPLLVSGVAHFTRTALMAMIIPPFLPYHSQLVLASGVLELAGAAGLLLPACTRAASACLALLMIAIFPANVYAANTYVGGLRMPSVPVRLTMQVVYILLLLLAGWGVPRRTETLEEGTA